MRNMGAMLRKYAASSSKGQVVQQLIPAVVVPIVLIIMLIVFANFEGTVDHSDISSTASTTINDTSANAYSGFDLGSILPIVIFGVVILSIIIGAFQFGRR